MWSLKYGSLAFRLGSAQGLSYSTGEGRPARRRPSSRDCCFQMLPRGVTLSGVRSGAAPVGCQQRVAWACAISPPLMHAYSEGVSGLGLGFGTLGVIGSAGVSSLGGIKLRRPRVDTFAGLGSPTSVELALHGGWISLAPSLGFGRACPRVCMTLPPCWGRDFLFS